MVSRAEFEARVETERMRRITGIGHDHLGKGLDIRVDVSFDVLFGFHVHVGVRAGRLLAVSYGPNQPPLYAPPPVTTIQGGFRRVKLVTD